MTRTSPWPSQHKCPPSSGEDLRLHLKTVASPKLTETMSCASPTLPKQWFIIAVPSYIRRPSPIKVQVRSSNHVTFSTPGLHWERVSNTSCSRSVSQNSPSTSAVWSLSICPHGGTQREGVAPAPTCRNPETRSKQTECPRGTSNQHSREHPEGHQTLVPAKQQQRAKYTVSQFVALLTFSKTQVGKKIQGMGSVCDCLKPVGTCTTQFKEGVFTSRNITPTAYLVHHPPPWQATQARPGPNQGHDLSQGPSVLHPVSTIQAWRTPTTETPSI